MRVPFSLVLATSVPRLETVPMPFRKRSERTYDEHSLYEYALGALGRKMRTVAELKRLMRTKVQKQQDGDRLIEQVIFRLKEQ